MTGMVELAGIIVPPSSLQLPRAQALAAAADGGASAYLRLVECRKFSGTSDAAAEAVVVDVNVERPQRLVNDIRRIERVAVVFDQADDTSPDVLALRDDFPAVTHTNFRPVGSPRSLCLYDQPWSELALRWTATAYLERIRFWLSETAKGTLHQGDQPLEQLLIGSLYRLVLPPDLFDGRETGAHEELNVRFPTGEDRSVVIARRGPADAGLQSLALSFVAQPQAHGAIRYSPSSLEELDAFLRPVGVPLLDRLRETLGNWNTDDLRTKSLLLIVAFPLTRNGKDTVEATDVWAFATTSTVAEVGIDIGLWSATEHGYGTLVPPDVARKGEATRLYLMLPQFDLTREAAAAASGTNPDIRSVVAVGAGALGSQVIRSLVQSGFGRWRIIDQDVLLPHNLARHQLGRRALGYPKALVTAVDSGCYYDEGDRPKSLHLDVLRPNEQEELLRTEYAAAEVILDTSASVPVARHLAHDVESSARRISAFLNPSGTDLVLLAEDAKRSTTLDQLEMQYYRAVARDERLADHLRPPEGRSRYARSCRDVTSVIPNHLVTLHAATAANAIRRAASADEAAIRVWRADVDSGEVRHVRLNVGLFDSHTRHEWTLLVDRELVSRLAEQRGERLPNETGGVLIGAYDLERRIIYVVDTILSPPDSEEWPTLYIRGKRGLSNAVERIAEATGGQLEYVGEWHSHPDGHPCLPSEDDLKVFAWLTKHMDEDGLPALMAIAGEGGVSEWYLCQMLKSGGWRTQL